MSEVALLVQLIILFLILVLIRVPIAFAMAGSAMILAVQLGVDMKQIAAHMYSSMGLFVLLAIPFFLLAGEILNQARLTHDIVHMTSAAVGRVRGGLAQVNIVVSMIFAGISGSSTADTAAVGSVIIPAMKESGFTARFSAAVTAASSTMGNIIPPSLYMIIYGSLAGVSIENLFIAGIIPGVLIGLSQMGIVNLYARRNPHLVGAGTAGLDRTTTRTYVRSLATAFTGVIIIGGLILGFFTATEAAAMAVLYSLALFFIFRTKNPFKKLSVASLSTVRMYAAILLTIGTAGAFGWVLAYLDGARLMADGLLSVGTQPYVILLMISLVLLFLGTFMSEIATIVIFTPVFLRLQEVGGIDPLHMGVVVVMMLCLGLITPPYGVCLLIATKISGATFGQVSLSILPFIAVFMVVVVVIIFVPQLTLFLPSVLGS